MKTYPLYLICSFIATLYFTACTNELPFDLAANPPKLAMNAFINADSLHNYVFLNLTGKDQKTHVKGATLEVRINGELTETLRPEEYMDQCRFCINSHFQPGDVIRLDAITDNGEHHAWGETTVPFPIAKIEKIDTCTVDIKSQYSSWKELTFKITITDRKNEDNFYRLVVESQTYQYFWLNLNNKEFWELYLTSQRMICREDVVLTDGNPSSSDDEDNGLFESVTNLYGVCDDTRFKNSSYTFKVSIPSPVTQGPWYTIDEFTHRRKADVAVRLLSITESEYYYLKALNVWKSDTWDEVINEPIKFPSNVHGGTGMVSASSERGEILHVMDIIYDK